MRRAGAARRPGRGVCWGLAALLLAAAPAAAQPAAGEAAGPEPAPEAAKAPASPQPIPLQDVMSGLAAASARLREIDQSLAADAKIAEIEAQLPKRMASFESTQQATRTRLGEPASLRTLVDLDLRWKSQAVELRDWIEALAGRVQAIQHGREQLAEMEATWQATLAEAREQEVPPALLERIGAMLAGVRAARERARERVSAVLAVQGDVADLAAGVETMLADVARAREQISGELFEPEQPPLWESPSAEPGEGSVWERVGASLRLDTRELLSLERRDRTRLLAYGLLLLALLPVTHALRARSRSRRAEGRSLGSADWVFEHPISIAVLATLPILVFVILPDASLQLRRLILVVSWVPIVLVLRRLLPEPLHPWLIAIASLYLFDRIRDFFEAAPFVERWLFALELAVAVVLLVWVQWPSRLRALPAAALPAWLGRLLRGAALALLAALVANVLGFVDLARLVGESLLVAAYAAVVLYAIVSVLRLFFAALLRMEQARRLRMVRSRGEELEHRFARIVGWAGVLLWLSVVLTAVGLMDPVGAALRGVLAADVEVGKLAFSVGDVVLFGVTVWLSLWASRILRAVLEDEVFPRAALGRGLPQTISTLAQYVVLSIGLLLAASAAGFDWSRITLLAGALGVGIGFGLQNIVNNFISGLILLFERPIQIGDTVQQGELVGEVRRIGIRSSTVRTWQGAEVIVPNADLISQQVVNWTLSDRERRIDLPVGVAYGSDPAQVQGLLRRVAAEHPDVLADPEPIAAFMAFGDSSLDFELRIWTGRPERMLRTRSELMVALHDALRGAGIAIPFPQRDLRVVSVEEEAARALAGTGRARETAPAKAYETPAAGPAKPAASRPSAEKR
jgi:small-conductance mechanosensitive channel